MNTLAYIGVRQCILLMPHSAMYLTQYNLENICQCTYDANGNLIEVVVPYHVKMLDNYSMACRLTLHKVTILSPITILPVGTFYGCEALTHVTLPYTLREIHAYVFSDTTNLRYLSLPSGLISIGPNTFTRSGISVLIMPDSVRYVGTWCFRYCIDLHHLVLSNSLQYIPRYMLYGCISLTSLTIPDTVHSIEAYSLSYTGISSLVIPLSVRKIEKYAFAHSALNSLDIRSNTIVLESMSIAQCIKLRHITLPDTPIDIDKQSFAGSAGVHDCIEENGYDIDVANVDTSLTDEYMIITLAAVRHGRNADGTIDGTTQDTAHWSYNPRYA